MKRAAAGLDDVLKADDVTAARRSAVATQAYVTGLLDIEPGGCWECE